MNSIYDLKPKFQSMLRPLTHFLFKKGITPNQITLLSLLGSFMVGALLVYSPKNSSLLLLPVFLFFRMALNAIDGMLAREYKMESALGAILNELGDIFSDVALYLPFCLMPGFSPYLMVFIVILTIISETTGILAIQIGGKRRYDGPMGKSDRAFIFGLMGLLIGSGLSVQIWPFWVQYGLIILLMVTIFNRASRALREASLS